MFSLCVLSLLLLRTTQAQEKLLALPELPGNPEDREALVFLQEGESLGSLARELDLPLQAILQRNPGAGSGRVYPGDAFWAPVGHEQKDALLRRSRFLRRGPRGKRRVALTIDCAWAKPEDITDMLQTLSDLQTSATFFLTGVFVQAHPDGAARIRARGHSLGNHSWSHPHFPLLNPDEMREEILRVDNFLKQQGKELSTRPWWRPPFGEHSALARQTAAGLGYRTVLWTVDALDWMEEEDNDAVDKIIWRVCRRPFEKHPRDDAPLDGAILLFHLAGRNTTEALRHIVPNLRQREYQFVSLETLLSR